MPKWKIKKKMDKAPTGAKRPTSGPYSKAAVEKRKENGLNHLIHQQRRWNIQ